MGWSSGAFWSAVRRKHNIADTQARSQADLRGAQADQIRRETSFVPQQQEAQIGLTRAQADAQRAGAGLDQVRAGLLPGSTAAQSNLQGAQALQALTGARGQSLTNQFMGSVVDPAAGTVDIPRAGLSGDATRGFADQITGGATQGQRRGSRPTNFGMTGTGGGSTGMGVGRFGLQRRLRPRERD